MNKPKITFIASGLGRGGAEVQLVQLAAGLADRKWAVSIMNMQPGGPYQKVLEDAGIKVANVACGRIAGPRAAYRLVKQLRSEHPRVVHTHAFRANLWGRLAAIALSIPVVASVRATYSYVPSFYYGFESWLGRHSLRVVTPAAATSMHLINVVGVPAPKVATIPNGVDLALFHPIRGKSAFRDAHRLGRAFVALAPGRLSAQKDHSTLLQAFRILLQHKSDARLIVAGSGPLEESLKQSVADLKESVIFIGDLDRPAIADAMSAADCVCLSSRFEGMPNVLLEAMASGKPCVSSATDGAVEVVRDGIEGFVVPIGDAPAMGLALATLAADQDVRRRMGKAGRRRVEAEYSIPKNITRYMEVYSEAFANERSGVV